jgi:hypothetical protein
MAKLVAHRLLRHHARVQIQISLKNHKLYDLSKGKGKTSFFLEGYQGDKEALYFF